MRNPYEATLSDFEVRMVAIAQTKGNDIRFDVVVDAGIEINENS